MRTPRCTALLFASLMSGIIGLGCGLGCPPVLLAQPPAFLENPRPDSFQSGLSVISGWVCEAERIEVIFDDDETQPWQAAYGTSRNDTRGACGDDGRNGFGLLFNWSLLEPGRHTLSVRADGREFAQATVTVAELGEEFLRGVGRYERLEDFPRQGTDSIVAWQESLQNFLIARTDPFAPSIQSMDAAGDSITKAFNADINTCPNTDQEELNWATSLTPDDGVVSQAERLESRQGAAIEVVSPNSAESGATMLDDFVEQTHKIKANLESLAAPRYTTVVLGHNDICGGMIDKRNADCPQGGDQDPNQHCRTTPEAFEREFRKGLDILIAVPDLKIGVASLVRVSQLCNHTEKASCVNREGIRPGTPCGDIWQLAPAVRENGICGSLTVDCSDERIADAYTLARQYRDILERVTYEYAAIPAGHASPTLTVGGQQVGGASKADGTYLSFSNASWEYKFTQEDLSCCDCFHPSSRGQTLASRLLFDGFTCSEGDVCCGEGGSAVDNGRCASEDTGGRFVPGLF